jgi:hypothetical protein
MQLPVREQVPRQVGHLQRQRRLAHPGQTADHRHGYPDPSWYRCQQTRQAANLRRTAGEVRRGGRQLAHREPPDCMQADAGGALHEGRKIVLEQALVRVRELGTWVDAKLIV